MHSQYGSGDSGGPAKAAAPAKRRAPLAFLLVAYALAAFAAPLGHVLEVLEGPALASTAQAAQLVAGAMPSDSHGDPLHEDVDCLTCLLLTVAGTDPVHPAQPEVLAPAVAVLAAAPEALPGVSSLPLPPSRAPPTA